MYRALVYVKLFYFSNFKLGKNLTISLTRKQVLRIGKKTVIGNGTHLCNFLGDLRIGRGCIIGISNCLMSPLIIGDYVTTAQHVVITGINHSFKDNNKPILRQPLVGKKVVLGSGVWVGANAVVLPGVTVGRNAVIGAGSVVTKDVPSFAVVVGNPAKIIKGAVK
jgi:acetyltransferase-like isoleucine patch superfamily enzyme